MNSRYTGPAAIEIGRSKALTNPDAEQVLSTFMESSSEIQPTLNAQLNRVLRNLRGLPPMGLSAEEYLDNYKEGSVDAAVAGGQAAVQEQVDAYVEEAIEQAVEPASNFTAGGIDKEERKRLKKERRAQEKREKAAKQKAGEE